MLDKKALRRFADGNPAPAIPADHGLLHAKQVDYIVRASVKTIARHRALVLYVYDRAKAADGDAAPTWTVFQARGEYATLARREDGTARWSGAAFENLGGHGFTDKCAFYSARDERRVRRFLHDRGHGGIATLVGAQRAIRDRRARERRRERERRTADRMRPIRALPRGWQGWAKRDLMPAYFFYDYKKSAKSVTGICSACGKDVTLTGAKHNAKAACPHCGRELTMKSKGRMGRIMDRDTVQFVQRTGPDELVVRIVKLHHFYTRDGARREFRENARIFVRRAPDGKVITEPYYYSYGRGTLTHWMPGERPGFFGHYQYCFEADTCGHVYCRNLPEALVGTPWEYCPVAAFYGHDHEPMQLPPFLAAHLEHPKLEHLIKVGFFSLASDLAYGRLRGDALDETQDRTHRILRIPAGDVAFLRELDADMETLKAFQGYADVKDRQKLLLWQLEHRVSRDVKHILEYVTAHKLMRYMNGQYAALSGDGGEGRYTSMQHAVSEYRDYLDMCARLEYDMRSSFVLYPKNLRQAHDEAAQRAKDKADARMRQDFEEAMRAISGHLDFEAGGMKVVLPDGPDDIVAEGQVLHHCVGGYVDRVARRECIILFVRRCGDESAPFYTMEIRDRRAVQVRGLRNCDPTPEVREFVEQFERRVLRAA